MKLRVVGASLPVMHLTCTASLISEASIALENEGTVVGLLG
jgi:hypothetical protein